MDLYRSPYYKTSFESIYLSVQEKFNIDFHDKGHQNDFSIFWSTGQLDTSRISDLNNFSYYFFICSYFWSIHLSNASYQISSQLAFLFGRRSEIDFQDGGHSGNLGLTIETILAILDIQVSPMLPTNFQADWPFGSGEEAKNRFSRSRP